MSFELVKNVVPFWSKMGIVFREIYKNSVHLSVF